MKILCRCCFAWKRVKRGTREAKSQFCAGCLRHRRREAWYRRFLRGKVKKLEAELGHVKLELEIIRKSHQTMTSLALEATGLPPEGDGIPQEAT